MREYTKEWNGFQFRSPTYVDGHFESRKFDLVKWVDCEPHKVLDLKTGKKKISDRYCYSVGMLEWCPKEKWFDFKSVGTRYLEARIDGLEDWILAFCYQMESKLLDRF